MDFNTGDIFDYINLFITHNVTIAIHDELRQSWKIHKMWIDIRFVYQESCDMGSNLMWAI